MAETKFDKAVRELVRECFKANSLDSLEKIIKRALLPLLEAAEESRKYVLESMPCRPSQVAYKPELLRKLKLLEEKWKR